MLVVCVMLKGGKYIQSLCVPLWYPKDICAHKHKKFERYFINRSNVSSLVNYNASFFSEHKHFTCVVVINKLLKLWRNF